MSQLANAVAKVRIPEGVGVRAVLLLTRVALTSLLIKDCACRTVCRSNAADTLADSGVPNGVRVRAVLLFTWQAEAVHCVEGLAICLTYILAKSADTLAVGRMQNKVDRTNLLVARYALTVILVED